MGAVLQPLPTSRCIQRKSTLRGAPRTTIIDQRMSHKCAVITLTVAGQCGDLAAIHVGLGHRARQALADPLLLGDVVLPKHGRAPFYHLHPTPKRHSRGTDAVDNSLGEYRATEAPRPALSGWPVEALGEGEKPES